MQDQVEDNNNVVESLEETQFERDLATKDEMGEDKEKGLTRQLREMEAKMHRSATCIQSHVRKWQAVAHYTQLRQAVLMQRGAVKIQSVFRGYRQRALYRKQKQAAKCLQLAEKHGAVEQKFAQVKR